MRLRSEAFLSGGEIPKRHTGDGGDISPSFRWEGAPTNTIEFALVCDDPDAGDTPWVHWILYKIPGEDEGVPEALPAQLKLEDPSGAVQGKNTFGTIGYKGPYPPKGSGTHHYRFTLFALRKELSVPAGADLPTVKKALEPHVIDKAELTGVYTR